MLTLRSFTVDDVPFGLRLTAQAGWNQTSDDWRRVVEMEPAGCFVGCWNGVAAATTTFCIFGDTAWIAMVLTDESFRGRGLATALIRRALEELESRGIATVRLDATALGRPVYERFGFAVDYEVTRFGTVATPSDAVAAEVDTPFKIRPLADGDWSAALDLDRRASRCDRRKLLQSLHDGERAWAYVADDERELQAFVFGRAGGRADQIGPCIARRPEAAQAVIRRTIQSLVGRNLLIDVPDTNGPACENVRQFDFVPQRKFFRMTRGPSGGETTDLQYASAGPEFG